MQKVKESYVLLSPTGFMQYAKENDFLLYPFHPESGARPVLIDEILMEDEIEDTQRSMSPTMMTHRYNIVFENMISHVDEDGKIQFNSGSSSFIAENRFHGETIHLSVKKYNQKLFEEVREKSAVTKKSSLKMAGIFLALFVSCITIANGFQELSDPRMYDFLTLLGVFYAAFLFITVGENYLSHLSIHMIDVWKKAYQDSVLLPMIPYDSELMEYGLVEREILQEDGEQVTCAEEASYFFMKTNPVLSPVEMRDPKNLLKTSITPIRLDWESYFRKKELAEQEEEKKNIFSYCSRMLLCAPKLLLQDGQRNDLELELDKGKRLEEKAETSMGETASEEPHPALAHPKFIEANPQVEKERLIALENDFQMVWEETLAEDEAMKDIHSLRDISGMIHEKILIQMEDKSREREDLWEGTSEFDRMKTCYLAYQPKVIHLLQSYANIIQNEEMDGADGIEEREEPKSTLSMRAREKLIQSIQKVSQLYQENYDKMLMSSYRMLDIEMEQMEREIDEKMGYLNVG